MAMIYVTKYIYMRMSVILRLTPNIMSRFEFLEDKGDFPLDRLQHSMKIQFSKFEADYIQLIYKCFLILNRVDYNNALLPPLCMGTAAELWLLIHFVMWSNNLTQHTTEINLLYPKKFHGEVLEEVLLQEDKRNGITKTTRAIFKKICRMAVAEPFDRSYAGFFDSDSEAKKQAANYLVPKMALYGQYPLKTKHMWMTLTEIEIDAISLTYLQIIYTQYICAHEFIMPEPSGTAMEIWFMTEVMFEGIYLISDNYEYTMGYGVSRDVLGAIFTPNDGVPVIDDSSTTRMSWLNDYVLKTVRRKMRVANYVQFQKKKVEFVETFLFSVHTNKSRSLKNIGSIPVDLTSSIAKIYADMYITLFSDHIQPFHYWQSSDKCWHVSRSTLLV
jgi:hypothetical protein